MTRSMVAPAPTRSAEAGHDYLAGGIRWDTIYGGTGNDTYYVDNTGDRVNENVGEGTDTTYLSIDWALAANVEALVLTVSGFEFTA